MTYSIFARDGTSRIVLRRETREAAEKKARELADLGWFEVQIEEEKQIERSREITGQSTPDHNLPQGSGPQAVLEAPLCRMTQRDASANVDLSLRST